jgi:hypothetical protein
VDVGPTVDVEMEEATGVVVLDAVDVEMEEATVVVVLDVVDVAVDVDKRVMPDGNTVAL